MTNARVAYTTEAATSSKVHKAGANTAGFSGLDPFSEMANAVPATTSAFVLSTAPARVDIEARCASSLTRCQ